MFKFPNDVRKKGVCWEYMVKYGKVLYVFSSIKNIYIIVMCADVDVSKYFENRVTSRSRKSGLRLNSQSIS